MKNFFAVLRLALRTRLKVALLVVCSLGIGLLWGANIGILYPFLEAVFYGETIPESLQRKLTEGERAIGEWERKAEEVESHPDESVRRREAALLANRIETQRMQVDRFREWHATAVRWMPATPYGTIVLIVELLIAAAVLRGLLLAANDVLVAQLTQQALFALRGRVYRHLLALDVEYFSEDRSPKIMTRMTHDMQRVGDGVSAALGQSLREPFKMLACLAGAAFISWRLLLFAFVLVPAGIVALRWMGKISKRVNETSLAAMSQIYTELSETLHGIRVVKSSTAEGFERRRFHRVRCDIRGKLVHAAVVRAVIKPVVEILGISVVALAILAGGWLVLNQRTELWGIALSTTPLSPAALLIFFAMLLGATDPLRKIAGLSITVNRSSAAADRVFQILGRKPRLRDPQRPVSLEPGSYAVSLQDVSFAYPDRDEPALKHLTLHVAAGECVGVIGANGSGKTTLLNLLLRFYDPTDGSVEVNGIDLRRFDQRAFRRRLGLIPQQPFLFDDTIENNIRYGLPSASDGDVRRAARQAGIDEFIERELTEGYRTIVGEGGNHLSGGQAQKISLARAILRDPGLLLLDEATSQLDALAELELVQRLGTFLDGRTTIMVTHRPALLSLADRIVLLDRGEIVETGTHAELQVRSRLYQEMLHEIPFHKAA